MVLQPFPFERPVEIEKPPPPRAPAAPADLATLFALLEALLRRLASLPGTVKNDSYLYDDRGVSPANPVLTIEVSARLRRPATSGFIISDTTTITVDINNKSSPVRLNAGDRFALSPLDPFVITNLIIRSSSTNAGVRIFLV